MSAKTGRTLTSSAHLSQSIADILTTTIGSRVMRREYGTLHGQEAGFGIQAEFLARLQEHMVPRPTSTQEGRGDQAHTVTTRELQVLRLLALGYRNREIAEKMFLSELTVKSHLRKINTKLGAQGRTGALAIARSRGLLD
ncbi:hypothetical protein JQX08_20755 [Pseudomonas sp. UL073]|uniref:HTH luxR-type domain-containing protein n=2 Tax=Zestomonas insulae TaxID=2809017 RepID=A0ABS2IME9_9GAMM|nr:hypothetical protein [Pseudomonas insulae]